MKTYYKSNGIPADRQRTHWHGQVEADNTQSAEYTEVVTEAVPEQRYCCRKPKEGKK